MGNGKERQVNMRGVKELIIHCSATRAGQDFGVADIDRWHRQRGWRCVGYHFVIRLDGTVEAGRPIAEAGAHCADHNGQSLGICYVGGLDEKGRPADTRTPAQRQSMLALLRHLAARFPGATIHGHNEFAAKACPSFNVEQWLREASGHYGHEGVSQCGS